MVREIPTHGLSRTETGHLRKIINTAAGKDVRIDWNSVTVVEDKITIPAKTKGDKNSQIVLYEISKSKLLSLRGKRGRKRKVQSSSEVPPTRIMVNVDTPEKSVESSSNTIPV